jgi:RNAse (barnase) inhibitor barstar
MAWQVAIVLDTEYTLDHLDVLVRQMPVWAVTTKARQDAAGEIRKAAGTFWEPEPAFTLFQTYEVTNVLALCKSMLSTILDHHPEVFALELIGISPSQSLTEWLADAGFHPTEVAEGLRFKKRMDQLGQVREIELKVKYWMKPIDFYNALFEALGAPAWHGRNFDALRDSIITGGINQIEPPYRIILNRKWTVRRQTRQLIKSFIGLIREFESRGHPVEIVVRN